MGNNRVPDRWLDYDAIGKQVYGTNFIAFKVPLKSSFDPNISSRERFSHIQLLQRVPNLGLVIDLTNTNRYYDSKVFEESGVAYEKVMTRGHEVPDTETRILFSNIVNEFLKRNSNSRKVIGVHCTHGVNRTGFLICYFMITQLKICSSEAIKRFEAARGYPIERMNYLDFLNGLRVGNSNINTGSSYIPRKDDFSKLAPDNTEQHYSESSNMRNSSRINQFSKPAPDNIERRYTHYSESSNARSSSQNNQFSKLAPDNMERRYSHYSESSNPRNSSQKNQFGQVAPDNIERRYSHYTESSNATNSYNKNQFHPENSNPFGEQYFYKTTSLMPNTRSDLNKPYVRNYKTNHELNYVNSSYTHNKEPAYNEMYYNKNNETQFNDHYKNYEQNNIVLYGSGRNPRQFVGNNSALWSHESYVGPTRRRGHYNFKRKIVFD